MAQRDQALIEGRQRFRDFAECAADWFWETDAEHRFTHISDRAGALLGFTPADHFGMTRVEANGADLADPQWAAHCADLEARRPFQDFEYDRHNGRETKTVRVSGRPIYDSDGRFRGYRGAGRDVTAEKAAARRLKEAKRHAEAANRAKSAFLANMSHELRTPLNAIIGFAEVIRDQVFGPVPPRYTAYAGDIVGGGRHLLQLLNDILDLSKIEAGHMTLAQEDVDLVREVDASLRVMRPVAEKAGLSLVNEVPADFSSVSVDPQRLRQILFNLLSNAVKFSDNAGIVAVGADRQDDFVRVFVRDQGIGIAKEDHEKVLQPFGQAETHLARTYQGTGLGLALVKRFAEMHNGTVEIVSELGSGTTVVVSLADVSKKRASAARQQPELALGIPAAV
jgi:PAS domain S-box-containing protein